MRLKIYSKSLFILFLAVLSFSVRSQELNCSVQVNSKQVSNGDKAIFDALQRSVYEFMNNRRWTSDKYAPSERIECSVLIQIDNRISTDQYEATFQVSSSRPVYGSTHSTTLFKYQDEKINFKYLQFDVLDYSDNAYISELTSVLAYYAYVFLAMDYDSFSSMGGQPFWQKAQQIVNNASSSGQSGWQAFSSRTNRYWLVQNYLDPRFKPLRECNYQYHRKGFDQMAENVQKGRQEVLNAIKLLPKVHAKEPNSFNVRLFFTAKADEIVKLFGKAEPAEKNELIPLLETLDPANTLKYTAIKEGPK